MAVFNPSVPDTQDPNYLSYPRVIDAPPPNTSSAKLINTISGSVDTGISIVDTAIKKNIDNEAYKQIDPIRDQFTQGLEQVKKDLDSGVVPGPAKAVGGTTSGSGSLLDANAEASDADVELPAGLESGLSRVDRLAAAKASGSPRLNDTDYARDTLSVAKQLRAQYPGYREYIDQRVSQASGLPVANSYYQNMLQDINRQLVQMSKQKDDVLSAMWKNLDVPGMPAQLQYKRAGDPRYKGDTGILQDIGDWQNHQTQQKIDAADRQATDWKNKDLIDRQTQALTRSLNTEVQLGMSSIKDVAGVSDAKGLLTFFDDVAAGRHPELSDTDIGQRRLQFNGYVSLMERRLSKIVNDYAPVVGSDNAQKMMTAAMAPLYTMQKFVNSKEDGPAFFHAQQLEAMKTDAKYGFLVNKDTHAASMQLLGARDILGEQYFPDFIKSMIKSDVDTKYKDMFNEATLGAIKPYTDARGNPIQRTMKDDVQHAKQVGADTDSNYYDNMFHVVDKLTDPRMPQTAKDNMINWAFNPKNIGRLNELKMDYRDPNTGEPVQGRFAAFNILSAPALTEAIRENAKAHPENYAMYKGTLETEFKTLYAQSIQDMAKIQDKPYLNVHFSYSPETKQFGLVDNNNKPIVYNPYVTGAQYPDKVYINGVLEKLDYLNKGLANIAHVQARDPSGAKDTDQYLLNLMQTIYNNKDKSVLGNNISGITENMAKALIQAKAPEADVNSVAKKLFSSPGGVTPTGNSRSNFAPEEDNSVESFIKNPTRGTEPAPTGESYQTRGVIKGNLSDSKILSIETQDIPEGMSAHDFLRALKEGKKFGGSVQ